MLVEINAGLGMGVWNGNFIKKNELFSQKDLDQLIGDIKNMDENSPLQTQTWELVLPPLKEEGTYYYNAWVQAGVRVPSTTYVDGKIEYDPSSWQADVTDQWDWIELKVIK